MELITYFTSGGGTGIVLRRDIAAIDSWSFSANLDKAAIVLKSGHVIKTHSDLDMIVDIYLQGTSEREESTSSKIRRVKKELGLKDSSTDMDELQPGYVVEKENQSILANQLIRVTGNFGS